MGLYRCDRYSKSRSGCPTYGVIAMYIWLLRGFFLECYGGVDAPSLPSEGDGWVFDTRAACLLSALL
jgi:hypothetical protein